MHSHTRRPVDRKMVINGLNSGANVYMADFEGEYCKKSTECKVDNILCTSD